MNELKIKKSLQFELTKEQQNELDKTGFIQLNRKYCVVKTINNDYFVLKNLPTWQLKLANEN